MYRVCDLKVWEIIFIYKNVWFILYEKFKLFLVVILVNNLKENWIMSYEVLGNLLLL